MKIKTIVAILLLAITTNSLFPVITLKIDKDGDTSLKNSKTGEEAYRSKSGLYIAKTQKTNSPIYKGVEAKSIWHKLNKERKEQLAANKN